LIKEKDMKTTTTTKTNKEETTMKTNQNTCFGIIAALIAVIFTLAAFTACTNPAEDPKRTPDPWEWEAIAAKSTIPAGWEEAMEAAWLQILDSPAYMPYIEKAKSIKIMPTSADYNTSNIYRNDENNVIFYFNPSWYTIIGVDEAWMWFDAAIFAALASVNNKQSIQLAVAKKNATPAKAFAKKIGV
jgi:hypothetical protein